MYQLQNLVAAAASPVVKAATNSTKPKETFIGLYQAKPGSTTTFTFGPDTTYIFEYHPYHPRPYF